VCALMNRRVPISGFDSPSRGQPRDQEFLGGQLIAAGGGALAGGLAGGAQFPAGTLREPLRAHLIEHAVGRAELDVRGRAAIGIPHAPGIAHGVPTVSRVCHLRR
jgi:hypothetical protein